MQRWLLIGLEALRRIEQWLRGWRYRWAARSPRLNQFSPSPKAQSVDIVFDLHSTRFDGPQGRRIYALILFFHRAGLSVGIFLHPGFTGNLEQKFKAALLQLPLSAVSRWQDIPPRVWVLSDRGPRGGRQARWIRLSAAPLARPRPGRIAWPFPMYPPLYARSLDQQLAALRVQRRPVLALFGGRVQAQAYSKGSVPLIYGCLNRVQALQAFAEAFGSRYAPIRSPEQWQARLAEGYPGLLSIDSADQVVAPAQWLQALAQARFFLALPGVRYPMSHNLIEAMAVGTVPVLEYPELMHPPLQDGVNCVVYRGQDDIPRVAEQLRCLSSMRWLQMSQAVMGYYDAHLQPTAAVAKVLQSGPGPLYLHLTPFVRAGGGLY